MERLPSHPWRLGRSVLALLLAFLVGGSAVELHPGEEAHGEATGFGTLFVASASHPEQAQHVESAGEASQRHPCAVCLHNLLTAGLHLKASPHTAPSLTAERAALPYTPRPVDFSRLPYGARGPPRA